MYLCVGRCKEHPQEEAILAEFNEGSKGSAAIEALLVGQGGGDQLPSSALKKHATRARAKPSETADPHVEPDIIEVEAGEEGAEADEEADKGKEDEEVNGDKGRPSRARVAPERLESSPRLKKPKPAAAGLKGKGATQKGVGRGQKRGPRGRDGEVLRYKKRGKTERSGSRVKAEGGEELPPPSTFVCSKVPFVIFW